MFVMSQVEQENLIENFEKKSVLEAAAIVWITSQYYKGSNSTTIIKN